MAKSILGGKGMQTDELMQTVASGEDKLHWDEILRHMTEVYAVVSGERKYSGIVWGWSFMA